MFVATLAQLLKLQLQDAIALGDVVPRAQELHIRSSQRRPTTRPRDDVIEVQIVGRAALDASSLVALPDFELDRSRNGARRFYIPIGRRVVGRCICGSQRV